MTAPPRGGAMLDAATLHLLRELAPQVLGAVVRRFRDFAAAEDAVQEALVAASQQWPVEGVPERPRAWLISVAARRVTDHVRTESARRNREAIVVSLVPPEEQLALAADEALDAGQDDTLELLFRCCHPALTPASAIALTLRAVGGLTTFEIAKAFLVPEATMAQRISRAKQTLRDAAATFDAPTTTERAARLANVMHVLYLIFNEGYAASSGAELARTDLAAEAIRLARMLYRVVGDSEVRGLLALMLLTDARRAARTGPTGELIPLDRQDRALWDRAAIAEGIALLEQRAPSPAGPYELQAAIAALHDEASSTDATDWPQILALYDALFAIDESPIVALNRVVAVAMTHGAQAGLASLAAIADDPRLRESHRVDAVRAHLLERAGDRAAAEQHYRRAAERTSSLPERDYLLLQAARARGE